MAIHWTPQQVEAIRSERDTLLVANAGTGKTTTVVGKIMWRLGLPFGIDPATGQPLDPPDDPCELHEIAAITFTEKAAYDLKRKLREAIEKSERADELRWRIDRASVGTIHSFCSELLRENALRLGIDPTFDIMDGDEAWAEQDRLIRDLALERLEAGDPAARLLLQRMRLTGWTHTRGVVDHVRDALRELRWHGKPEMPGAGGSHGRPPGQAPGPASGEAPKAPTDDAQLDVFDALDALDADDAPDPAAGLGALDANDRTVLDICEALLSLGREAQRRWDAYLAGENRRDFDSLILGVRELLTGDRADAALRAVRARYRLLIVDEFQDTDFAQRDIAFAIGGTGGAGAAGPSRGDGAGGLGPGPQLLLVGDPKQSVYRFRGADIAVWNEVEASFRKGGGQILDLTQTFRSAPPIVEFVNRVAEQAIESTARELETKELAGRVHYKHLVPGIDPFEAAGVEWLMADGANTGDRREAEARHVAAWIAQHVGDLEIRDPDTDEPRKLAYRDCAVLYRARTGIEHFERALTRYGIPYYVSGASYLNARQEIVDVLNALRVLQAPRDDLRAFGYLRSPFVGLRDETLARIRLLSGGGPNGGPKGGPMLVQARRALDGEWPEAPDHPDLADLEREALRRGLDLLDELRELSARMPLDELIDELLERSGYRLHLLLMDRPEGVLANLQSLVHFAEAYRHLDLSGFFEVWERAAQQDIGIPQAPLYSKEDDVVTLSTIHAAKGLEWPVVFLVAVDKEFSAGRLMNNTFWSDRELGPVFCLKKDERGPRAAEIAERHVLEETAEEARLLYVAATRARDRLVIVGPRGGGKGYDQWLSAGVPPGVDASEDGDQLPVGGGDEPRAEPLVVIRTRPFDIEPPPPAPPPSLVWLDAYETTNPPALIEALDEPPLRWIHSATELMLKARDPEAWGRRYRHGVEASWEFAPKPAADGEPVLKPTVRGSIIHGVLERLESAAELSRILDETIGSLDEPELEDMLGPGARYREALEAEIRRVVESPEWTWYTEGELGRDYWKELTFTHLVDARNWRVGAFDLFRLRRTADAGGAKREAEAVGVKLRAGAGGAELNAPAGGVNLIIDFKTHQKISAEQVAKIAEDYRIQADVYGAAGRMAGPVAVRLHFTGPNVSHPMTDG